MSDHITLPTHISYFFFRIAATVAAISGKLVPAATIVAHIAHSDIPNCCAMKIAAETMRSDEITSNQRLASSLIKFNNFHCERLLNSGISLL